MAYLAGLTLDELQDERRDAEATRQLIRAAVGFVLGFSTVFVALGATPSLIGQSLARYFDVLSIVAGVSILVMGLHFLGGCAIALVYGQDRVSVGRGAGGRGG